MSDCIKYTTADKVKAVSTNWKALRAAIVRDVDVSMAAMLSMCGDKAWHGPAGGAENFRVASVEDGHAILADRGDWNQASQVWASMTLDEKLDACETLAAYLGEIFEEGGDDEA